MANEVRRWPAEWEPHAATWLAWPHNRDTWPTKFEMIAARFAELVRIIARFEPVSILAGGGEVMADAAKHVNDLPNVQLIDIRTDDAWCRDHGPTFVTSADAETNSRIAIVDWQYNAWGNKYPPFDNDNRVPQQIAELLHAERFEPGIVLEGGAIDGNGCGTVMTTETCLLNANRNADLSRSRAERHLADYLGVTKVLWLPRGELAGDDTEGHIDQLARFINPTTVVVAREEDTSDSNHEPLRKNFEWLQQVTDQDGRPLEVVCLPMPKPKHIGGLRVPASYCNFYFVNGGVIVPQFDDPADKQAMAILRELIPDREVVGVSSLDLAEGLGSVHCLTQQQPTCDYQ